MKVYLTGERERANPSHVMYVSPAGDARVAKMNLPEDWLDDEKKPRTFPIQFKHGKADVDDRLGKYLIDTGQAAASSILRPSGRSILGSMAERLSPSPARTQF